MSQPEFHHRIDEQTRGRNPAGENFLAGKYLHHELQQRVIGVFELVHTDKTGLQELVDKAQDVISGIDIERQQVLMDRFYKELENGGGLAEYGEPRIRKNLAAGAVGTLLLSASLRKERLQITCQDCGHSEERTFQLETGGTSVKDILTHTCHICSAPIIENGTVDLIEELTRLADLTDGNTAIISDNFEAGSQFMRTYGGIGALLRYKTEI